MAGREKLNTTGAVRHAQSGTAHMHQNGRCPMEIHEKQGYRSEGRGVNESDNMYRVVLQGVSQRELFALEAWVARQNTAVEPGNIHQQPKCEIAEDL